MQPYLDNESHSTTLLAKDSSLPDLDLPTVLTELKTEESAAPLAQQPSTLVTAETCESSQDSPVVKDISPVVVSAKEKPVNALQKSSRAQKRVQKQEQAADFDALIVLDEEAKKHEQSLKSIALLREEFLR